ncbi:YqgE/AlgH family protein [Pseudomonas sp. F1_0610]|uniref:YqgE/AlgH family protein n=1 Tax=Pseudomonas sp. F1_0610 TaxID=3114284 RepID=UPI0039C28DF0
MNSQSIACLAQHFLIAMPQMDDDYFAQSLIYLIQHDTQGSMGLVVNRPANFQLADVLQQLKPELASTSLAERTRVYIGGPVEQERGLILHKKGTSFAHTLDIGTLCLTSSQDILHNIAKGEGPADCLIVLGYAGWSAQQLEDEIAANLWLVSKADTDIIFHVPAEQRRDLAAKAIGIDLTLLSPEVGRA